MTKRRKHERLVGAKEVFAAIFRDGSVPVAGQIADISAGGVGLNYLALKDLGIGKFNLYLFSSGEHPCHLERLKCRVIYNALIQGRSWGELLCWRCGIQFEPLPENTRGKLRNFIADLGRSLVGPS
ncbi:MAG: PilZ domain-containing protein [Syntrophobacteraceae bacterium]